MDVALQSVTVESGKKTLVTKDLGVVDELQLWVLGRPGGALIVTDYDEDSANPRGEERYGSEKIFQFVVIPHPAGRGSVFAIASLGGHISLALQISRLVSTIDPSDDKIDVDVSRSRPPG